MTNIEEFHKRHDPSGPYIVHDGWVYWPDGARRENNGYGLLVEPSPDPHRQAQYIEQYWSLAVERAVIAFDNLRRQLEMAAACVRRDGATIELRPDSLVQLSKLQRDVLKAREQHQAAQAAVQGCLPDDVKRRKAAADARRAEAEEFAAKLAKITI